MLIKYESGQEPSANSNEAEAFRNQYKQIKDTEEQHLDSAREWAKNNPDLYAEASKEYEENALGRIYQAMNMQNYDLASAILSDLRRHNEGVENIAAREVNSSLENPSELEDQEDVEGSAEIDQIKQAAEELRDYLREYMNKTRQTADELRDITRELGGVGLDSDLMVNAEEKLAQVNELLASINQGASTESIKERFDEIAGTKTEVENDELEDSEVGEDGEIKKLKGELKEIIESGWNEAVKESEKINPNVRVIYLAGLKRVNPKRFYSEGLNGKVESVLDEIYANLNDYLHLDNEYISKTLSSMKFLDPSRFEQMKSEERFGAIIRKVAQYANERRSHLSYNIAGSLIELESIDPDKYREIVNSDDFKEASEYFLNKYCSGATYPDDSRESPPYSYGFRYKKLFPEFKIDPKRTLEKYIEFSRGDNIQTTALSRWQDAEFAELKGGE